MTMDPKDRKSDLSQTGGPEQDLDAADLAMIQGAWSGLEGLEPPQLIDQAVLNAARRELAARRRKPLRWIGAFATASVMVLALTIVLQQDHEPMKAPSSNGAKLDAVAPLKVQAEARSERQEPPEESVSGTFGDTLPESRAMESGTDQGQLMKQSVAAKRELGAGPEMAIEPAVETLESEFEMAPAAEGKERSADADFRNDATPVDSESMERFRDEAVKLRAQPRQSEVLPKKTADAEKAMGERVQTLGAATAASPVAEQDEASSMLPDPDEWIQRMLLLRQSELYEQLEQELAEFKAAYPNHPLPPELRD